MCLHVLKLFKTVSYFCLLVLLVSGCSFFSKKTAPLRIALNAWPGYEFLYLAHEKGFYKELGLETEIVQFASLADARKAFERGQVDVVGTTLVEVLFARDKSDLNPKAFYVVDYSDGADVIVANKKIKSVKELKGKKVAVEVGSVCVYGLGRALENAGLKMEDVVVVSMDQDTMAKSLKDNKVDAIVTYPPVSLEFVGNKDFNTIFTSKEVPFEIVDVLAAPQSLFESRKDDLKKIVKGYEKAKTYAFDKNSDGMALMAKREGLSQKDFELALTDGLVLVPFDGQKDKYFKHNRLQNITQKVEEFMFKAGQIKNNNISKDVAEWVVD